MWEERYVVEGGVFEFVLLFVVENNAVIVYEIQDACFPERAAKKLH